MGSGGGTAETGAEAWFRPAIVGLPRAPLHHLSLPPGADADAASWASRARSSVLEKRAREVEAGPEHN
jgi:hypothetical protein